MNRKAARRRGREDAVKPDNMPNRIPGTGDAFHIYWNTLIAITLRNSLWAYFAGSAHREQTKGESKMTEAKKISLKEIAELLEKNELDNSHCMEKLEAFAVWTDEMFKDYNRVGTDLLYLIQELYKYMQEFMQETENKIDKLTKDCNCLANTLMDICPDYPEMNKKYPHTDEEKEH